MALYGAGESRFVMQIELFLHMFCLVPLAWFFAVHLELGLLGAPFVAAVEATVVTRAQLREQRYRSGE